MKKTIFLITLGLLSCGFSACSDDDNVGHWVDPDIPAIKDFSLSRSEEEVKNGINKFGFDLMRAVSQNYYGTYGADATGNITVSPLSAALCMAMVANSCDDASAQKMADVLYCDDLEALNTLSNKLIRFLSHKQDIIVSLANSVWYNKWVTVDPGYGQSMFDTFYAPVQSADFSLQSTVDLINSWAGEKTNGMIPRVIDQIDPTSVVIWANAMYAAGEWNAPFDPKDTGRAMFNGRDMRNVVDMMESDAKFEFYGNTQFSAVRLPFKGNGASMIFILPDEGVTVDQLLESLSAEDFDQMRASWKRVQMIVRLPKFDIAQKADLNEAYRALGVPGAVKYTFISTPDAGGVTTWQCARIMVDEHGAKAAAVTVSDLYTAPMPSILTFDRPFLYFFCDDSTGTILLSGRVCNL